jgi:hypothetical protein
VTACFALLACLATLAPRDPAGPVFNGRERQLDIRLPRIEADVAIDGRLDEPPWQGAARLTGFSRYAPTDGDPAEDSTEVLVWYSPTAIHFGIRAFAEPGTVRATLADRDKMFSDDYVGIFIGTFNDGRQATVFGVNPLGIQGDGILVESGQASSGFSGLSVGREPTDISPDYVFQSKGRVTDFGFEIEIRIPFKSLTYQAADPQTWSINVLRKVQSRGYEYSWAPARRAAASYIAQHGHLVGLTDLRRGVVLDVNPVVTTHMDGAPATGGYRYNVESPDFGLNARWGITNNLTLNGTVNPDFAEVESDAGQFIIDPRQALFFPEKRPFFLEGLEQFATPANLVYTRRILSPLVATKLTGKVAGTTVALLSAVDDPLGSVSGKDHPLFGILRVKRDLGASSRLGLIVTDKEEGASSNRVGGADLRLVVNRQLSAQVQGVLSRTERPNTPVRTGPLWSASVNATGRTMGARYAFSGISDDFRTSSGFVGRPDIAHGLADHSYTIYGRRGALLESTNLDVLVDGVWQYERFTDHKDALEKKLHFNTNYTLRGGWHAGASVLFERFGFDDALYANYAVERHISGRVDTVAFTGTARIPNRDYVLSLDTPRFKHFAFSAFYLWGRDENFFEWAPANIGYLTLGSNWNPTEQLRVESSYSYQFYHRPGDGSTVGRGHIPRLKVEYQLNRAMFLRVVGQYTTSYRDSLRDDSRTNDPILLRGADGAYERAGRESSNLLRGEWLFSFLPSPGTVIYVGYGSNLSEPESFRFNKLERQNDGFFLKLSYLFRL